MAVFQPPSCQYCLFAALPSPLSAYGDILQRSRIVFFKARQCGLKAITGGDVLSR
ncbi:hypothetical protein HMPREF9371_1554 [Neisseria shayeganii 871]|uniref:Uncharacterized protein n=1 Tax=Neisseria shayeganii 871 TaxID=1032488 RepID=G4CIW5_9NEIS|nr:hypothetical protein HMPREF9371_1554 [Neisseria shayeganii 871]